jgi:LuxR family maltose regulon positive regulatory protein
VSDSLLTTKLFIPPSRPSLVHRARLIDRLNRGLHRKLTLVSAPAGFGKTTLITDWLASVETTRELAWLSLDEGENDLFRFLTYMIAALKQLDEIAPAFGEEALNRFQTSQSIALEPEITLLINEIAAIDTKFILVMDDFHLISNQAIHDAISFLIEYKPPQFHLVILTREDPQFSLSRLRARDQLTEIRALDLRFQSVESEEFLNRVMGLELSIEDINALESRTEGWIAGLQLAAISLRGQTNASQMIQSFTGSHRLILDYLIEEVLNRQSESIQDFLLKTSILDRLNDSLCDVITGEGNSQQILEYLDQANLFILSLDSNRNWYRYHHLFSDLLRQRLNRTCPESVAELHLKASEWYEQNGFTDEAIEHALNANDLDRAADLAELAWRELNLGYRSLAWLGWVRMLPEELIRSRPMLSAGYAWALIDNGDLDGADRRFRDAERWLEAQSDAADLSDYLSFKKIVLDTEKLRSLAAWIANGRAYLVQARGDYPGTLRYAQQAIELLPENEFFERGLAAVLSGFAYWANGDLVTARQSVVEAIDNMRTLGNLTFIISFSSYLADILIAQGCLREAEKVFLELLDLAAVHGKPDLPAAAVVYLGLSEIAFERGDIDEAREYLIKGKAFGELPTLPPWFRHWILARTRIRVIDDDLDGVIKILENAEQLYYRHPIPDVRPLKTLTARAYLAAGALSKALQWVSEEGLIAEDDISFLREYDHITLAKILISRSRFENHQAYACEASDLLERLLIAAEDGLRMKSVIEILALMSLTYDTCGNLSQALKTLERAVQLAEPEGFVQIFVGEGAAMEALLKRISPEEFKFKEFIRKLLASFNSHSATDISFDQPLIDPLSEREIEVLALIAQGLTNQEIGKRLYLSLNTVKVHTRNIYSKLGVNNRTQAVAQARSFGILPGD